jgi:hypothetical protein
MERKVRLLLVTASLFGALVGYEPAQAASPAYVIAITSPAAQQTIQDNDGDLQVEVEASPVLSKDSAARWVVQLDGNDHAAIPVSSPIRINGIDRGQHVLRVELQDAKGEVIAASEPVTFYMWQASRLFPTRR